MEQDNNYSILAVKLKKDEKEALKRLAKDKLMPMSFFVRKIIMRELKRSDKYAD